MIDALISHDTPSLPYAPPSSSPLVNCLRKFHRQQQVAAQQQQMPQQHVAAAHPPVTRNVAGHAPFGTGMTFLRAVRDLQFVATNRWLDLSAIRLDKMNLADDAGDVAGPRTSVASSPRIRRSSDCFVQPDYEPLFDRMQLKMKAGFNQHILVGSPGMGKSAYATYLVCRALLEGLGRVVYYERDRFAVVLDRRNGQNLVSQIYDGASDAWRAAVSLAREGFYVCDSQDFAARLPVPTGIFTLMIVSPKNAIWKKWQKDTSAIVSLLPPPSRETMLEISSRSWRADARELLCEEQKSRLLDIFIEVQGKRLRGILELVDGTREVNLFQADEFRLVAERQVHTAVGELLPEELALLVKGYGLHAVAAILTHREAKRTIDGGVMSYDYDDAYCIPCSAYVARALLEQWRVMKGTSEWNLLRDPAQWRGNEVARGRYLEVIFERELKGLRTHLGTGAPVHFPVADLRTGNRGVLTLNLKEIFTFVGYNDPVLRSHVAMSGHLGLSSQLNLRSFDGVYVETRTVDDERSMITVSLLQLSVQKPDTHGFYKADIDKVNLLIQDAIESDTVFEHFVSDDGDFECKLNLRFQIIYVTTIDKFEEFRKVGPHFEISWKDPGCETSRQYSDIGFKLICVDEFPKLAKTIVDNAANVGPAKASDVLRVLLSPDNFLRPLSSIDWAQQIRDGRGYLSSIHLERAVRLLSPHDSAWWGHSDPSAAASSEDSRRKKRSRGMLGLRRR